MNVDWAVLGQVILVSVLMTTAVVGLFSLGIRAGAGGGRAAEGTPGTNAATRAAGYLCFALCAAAVAYGIWIIAT
ncbi:hypothetical protein RM780_07425 [Streptomyces sp. DSM 44917]|uniref:Secreted protein n=1 Tax=Streptomyces boetiae TaxID=3075541 RepID=A0ABU2L5L0_9ACTN|nr:hypothetical protein [Streptomyces sp. DSM 44917]MDT0306792.1 hypothetical protein [Streptomyces sp. DSM 44917]